MLLCLLCADDPPQSKFCHLHLYCFGFVPAFSPVQTCIGQATSTAKSTVQSLLLSRALYFLGVGAFRVFRVRVWG